MPASSDRASALGRLACAIAGPGAPEAGGGGTIVVIRRRVMHALLCVVVCLIATSAHGADAERAKRVLMVHSFGSSAPPFTTHSTAFETALTQEMGTRVDLDEVSLDMARYGQPDMEEPFAELLEKRLATVVESTAAAYGAKAKLTYRRGYPVLVNHERQAEFAASVASQVAGQDKVDTSLAPMMGAEDFSYMLNARPGAFIWIGNGDSAGLHHPAYNFNDDVIPFGTSYWVKLVETALAA